MARTPYSHFTNQELALIREKYPTMTAKELQKLMPRHTIPSIGTRGHQLGIRKGNGNISRYAKIARDHNPTFDYFRRADA